MQLNKRKTSFFIILLIIICINQSYFSKFNYILGKENNNTFEFHNNTDYRFEEKTSYDTGYGIIADLFLNNNYLYTAIKQAGMIIFDVTNPEQPIFLSNFDTHKELKSDSLWDNYGGLTTGIFVRDNIAYLGDGLNGLAIIDVQNSKEPILLSHLETVSVSNLAVNGNFVFGKLSADKIPIINIENPRNPILVNTIDSETLLSDEIFDFEILNNRMYVTTTENLIVLNIDDPTEPIEITRVLESGGLRVAINEEILYIYKYQFNGNPSSNSILLYNISNPDVPILLNEYFLYGINEVQSFNVENSILYLASENSIAAFDFLNKTKPSFLGEIKNIGYGTSYKKIFVTSKMNNLFNDLIFCADQNKGLLIFNFTDPTNPFLISKYDLGSKATSIEICNEHAYLIKSNEFPSLPSILETLAISDSFELSSINKFISNTTVISDVVVEDNLCYISKSNYGFDILNVSSQEDPKLIFTFNHNENSSYWSDKLFYEKEKQLLFLANSREGFAIIDVSNHSSVKLLYATNASDMGVSDLYVCNNLLFLAQGGLFSGGLTILNISNPLSPKVIYQISLNDEVTALFCIGNLLYLSTLFSLLKIYDISKPENPTKIGELPATLLFETHELIVNNSIAYLARDANGLLAIDVSNSRKPRLLTIYRDLYAGISYDLSIKDKYIILADGWDGIEILELIPPKITRALFLTLTIIPPITGLILLIVITSNIARKKQK
ncbi:MAG TPA: hypothetical protein VMZ29_13180 [Candidatus Bathyarchaeia archaeon]|nr:hypothetical protein [Candidatus Bathyarchaeia archaeon]